MSEITIREIRESDYSQVAAIWRDVLDLPNATDEIVSETYEQMKQDSNYRTFVAEADGRIVGLAAAVKVLAIGHPGGYVKMNGLGVLPAYRKQGIGRMLLERVEQMASEMGAPYVGLASGIRRTEAHVFYEHMGYRKTSWWFRKNLE
ncbi:MAG: GNAT family N-acetyltransferase [Clostridia bacterium]|nr:GNAT family N-acetyltransferase [Clostridia bacterium]